MTRGREARMARILALVANQPVHTQEDLANLLRREGWDVTQSSVSRDIATLGLVKSPEGYQRPASEQGGSPSEVRIRESTLSVALSGDALVVVHTAPGEANRVASAIDQLGWPGVVGTVAGDDTLFVATRDEKVRRQVIKRLGRIRGPRPAAADI